MTITDKPRLKEVSLKQFHNWYAKNLQKTWNIPEGFQKGATYDVKYFELSFDSRFGKIWAIRCHGGAAGDFRVSNVMEGKGDLLENIDKELEVRFKRRKTTEET